MACNTCNKKNNTEDSNEGLITKLQKCLSGDYKYSLKQIEEHENICAKCPHATIVRKGHITQFSMCNKCHCFLKCKTKVDVCPLGKWGV